MSVLGELWVKLGLKKSGFDTGMKDAEKKTSSLHSKVKEMGAGMKAVWTAVGAVVAGKAAQMVKDMATVAAKAEGIRTAFERIADGSVLEGLRQATRNTVDDVTLMQKTIQASNFGIPIGQLATYFKFATERAIQTGESVDYLVDSIVTGLGRKSVMILDNLGISAAEIRDEMAKGGDMAQAVGAIIQREMEKAGKVSSTAAVTFQQTKAAWENFKVSVGNSSVIQSTLSALAKGAAALVSSFDKIHAAGGVAAYNMQQTVAEELEYLRAEGLTDTDILSEINKRTGWYETKGKTSSLTKGTDLTNIFGGESSRKQKQYYEALINAAAELERQQNAVTDAVNGTGKALGDSGEEQAAAVTGAIAVLEDQISKLNEKRSLLTDINAIAENNTQTEALQEELDLLKKVNAEYLAQKEYLTSKEGQLKAVASAAEMGARVESGDYSGLMEGYNEHLSQQLAEGETMSASLMTQMQTIEQAGLALSNAVTSGMISSLDYLADVMAGVEEMDAGKMLQSLLDPLANAAISAGVLIMSTGEGIEALKVALMSFGGYAAIVAGGALIALGVAAKAGLSALASGSNKTSSNSTTSYNWTGGYATSSSTAAQQTAAIDVNVTGRISGQDIVLATEKYNANKKR